MPQRQPASPDALFTFKDSDQKLESNTESYRYVFGTANEHNTPNKFYTRFTAQDFSIIPRSMDGAIVAAIQIGCAERYDLFDSIKPTAMSRIEFMHVLLREAKKRDILEDALELRTMAPAKPVTVARPTEVAPARQTTAAVNALDVTMLDSFTEMMKNPRYAGVMVSPDVAPQIGLPKGQTNAMKLATDMQTLVLGYIVGSKKEFLPDGKLPFQLYFDTTKAEQLPAYCAGANAIAQPGRAVDQTVGAVAGFLMAREDGKQSFQGMNAAIGIHGATCDVQAQAWNNSLRLAMAGVNNATRVVQR